MASDLTNTLIGCQDPNPQVRTAAEAALASAEQSNLAEFFLALGKEVSFIFVCGVDVCIACLHLLYSFSYSYIYILFIQSPSIPYFIIKPACL